jgi:HEPN domain-containing protein
MMMNIEKLEEIERKISQIYMNRGDEDLQKIELPMQAVTLVRYSEHYLAAAKAIEDNHILILPYLQMAGQSIELLLKACLAGLNEKPPHEHDLIKLSKRCVNSGYCISESDIAWIVHLNQHFYHISGHPTFEPAPLYR